MEVHREAEGKLIPGSKGGRRMGGMEYSATGSRLLFAANEKRQTVAVCQCPNIPAA